MTLIMYHGKECPHCRAMDGTVEDLEEQEGVTVTKREVWHDEENNEEMQHIDAFQDCGGVPFFYNTETGDWICGETSYDTLVDWATGN